jgi:hypothetical protein
LLWYVHNIMKTKTYNKTIHQYVERLLRHKIAIGLVLMAMGVSLVAVETHVREMIRTAYMQGWGWMGVYTRVEHPTHLAPSITVARIPKISSNR